MFLFGTTPTPGDSSNIGNLTSQFTALQGNVIGKDAKTIFKNVEESMISIMDSAKTLQRNMGDVASNTSEFSLRIMNSYKDTIKLGGSLQDVYDSISSLSEGMGKIVSPSELTLTNMTKLSLSTNLTTKEIGTMVAEMDRFGGKQLENVAEMTKMGKEARLSGLNAKTYISEIGKNLKTVSGFGFKNGIEGVKSMAKQALLLRTTMDQIGAKGFAADILDPENAMKAAASFQMLGGSVGKLSDPFQLLHMAQTDMAGLQEEMVNATKSSFAFNKANGGFEASTQDLYRLREMAKITGQNFDEMLESGKEAAKLDFLKKNFGIENMSEDDQNIIAGLTQIGKGGGVEVNIPGFGKLEAGSAKDLEAKLKQTNVQNALEAYKAKAIQTDSEIAKSQLTVAESQAATINEIKFAVISMMTNAEKTKFQENIKETNDDINSKLTKVANDTSVSTTTPAVMGFSDVQKESAKNMPEAIDSNIKIAFAVNMAKLKDLYSGISVNDLFVGSGSKPKVMVKNQIYEGIVGDEVAMGTGLSSAFDKSSKLNKVMSQIMSASQQGSEISGNQNLTTLLNGMSSKLSESPQQGSSTVDGKIDININLNGSISGDNGNLEKVFSDPRVQKQIMDTVLYKLKGYTQKQGVLSNNS